MRGPVGFTAAWSVALRLLALRELSIDHIVAGGGASPIAAAAIAPGSTIGGTGRFGLLVHGGASGIESLLQLLQR